MTTARAINLGEIASVAILAYMLALSAFPSRTSLFLKGAGGGASHT